MSTEKDINYVFHHLKGLTVFRKKKGLRPSARRHGKPGAKKQGAYGMEKEVKGRGSQDHRALL